MRADKSGDRLERHLTAEHVAARALLEAGSIDEAAPRILEAICHALDWEHGALWVIDGETDTLKCAMTWNPPGTHFPEFDAISRAATFKKGAGLPGRVWASGNPAWIPDVAHDTNFPRAPIAVREGLHAAFGFPVMLKGEVLSVMEFFSREIREPDQTLLSTLTNVGNQIGMFIERRRAQEELDRFFALSLDMLCIANFDGYFTRVNPAWQKQLGWTEQELLTRPYIELIHPDDLAPTIEAAKRLSEGHEVVYFENRYFHKDGTLRWLLWASTPLKEQKVIYGAARDITERKAAMETMEELVRALEVAKHRAEEATATKSAFLANMSHEIRTPLNAILGMTTLALQTRLTVEQHDYLSTVKSSANSLLGIINDILDFSKIEAKRLDLERTEFDLRETVGEAAKVLALRASEKGIELACEVMPDVPELVVGDAGRLRQILVNVVGNAVKFTTHGEVVLRVHRENATADRVRLHFLVSDTGIGIPADKLGPIFQAFTQADNSTTRRYGGTGLGLAIVQRLVDLMGGRIWAESTVGHGSTFHFIAEFGTTATASTAPPAERPGALEGLRVLVVDDNATNRRILEQMLVSWHMRATAVSDASSAMAALRKASESSQRYDVVITDCQMPDTDGFMLARQIKDDRRVRNTAVVMLTSMGRSEDVARSKRMGLEAYLTKPVKQSDLLDTLTTVFGVSTRRRLAGAKPARPSRRARRRLRVLVAEDNAVNRKLVTTLLRKRGHEVTAVDDGRAAVKAVEKRATDPFDVVVMDVQMPTMSGFEATHAIRREEEGTGRHVPIVALTAHAMQGDRERCLAAGMDGYLTKPIDVEELVATVERLGTGENAAGKAPVPSAEGDAAFDEAAALAHTGGDRKLLTEIVKLFRSDSAALLGKIDRAVRRRDAEALRMAAHALKGAAGTVGGDATRQAAAVLERRGRSGSFDGVKDECMQLSDCVRQLNEAFERSGLVRPLRRSATRKRRTPSRRKRTRS